MLHAIVGVSDLDERLSGVLRPVPAPGMLADDQSATMADLTAQWSRRRSANGALTPIELVGEDAAELENAAAHVCTLSGLRLFAVTASELPQSPEALSLLLRRIQRDLVLADGCLMVAAGAHFDKIGSVADVIDRGPIVIARTPLRGWSLRRPRTVALSRIASVDRARLWSHAVGGLSLPDGALERAMGQFHLSPSALRSVGRRLRDEVEESDDPAAHGHALWRACQTEASAAISDLAEEVAPCATWDDLVLPSPQMALLRALAAQARHRSKVYDEWGFADRSARGLGAAALFAGPSGTGKTLAAEVIAGSLDLAVWRIDLSQVFSKWISETEKNLARVFEAADPGGAVLLFDEADALFGKRSDVKDSHDRYANLEVSFLLQRMETYRGLAILTTNNEDALDKAFVRRLRTVVHFPFPDARTQGNHLATGLSAADADKGAVLRQACATAAVRRRHSQHGADRRLSGRRVRRGGGNEASLGRGANRMRQDEASAPRGGNRGLACAMTRIVVHIEELVLHGFDAASRHTIGDAARAEIERRLSAGDIPHIWRRGAAIDRIAAGEMRLPVAPRQAGAAIGAAVYRSLVVPQGGG